jgi:hypothetical protein
MNELPLYRLAQKAYMPLKPGDDDRILAVGTEVVFTGAPGEHMEPVNEAAKLVVKEHGTKSLRPELKLPMQAAGGGEAGAMIRQSLGVDLAIDANVVGVVAQLLVRVSALEARLSGPLIGQQLAGEMAQRAQPITAGAPPPPPLPRKAAG